MNYLLLSILQPQSTFWQVVLLVLGISMVLKGADWLTAGAASLARRMGISQMVVGLTVVAMGTSMPEFCVSLLSAIQGTPDLAVGNIVGSNIFNALLIVGCAAMVAPIAIQRTTVRRDIPVAVFASILLMGMTLDGHISRIDALILTVCFVAYMVLTVVGAKRGGADAAAEPATEKPIGKGAEIGYIVLGLILLVGGSELFVNCATGLAHSIGISDAVIGLTIVAGGTSLPELATSVVAAKKGDSGIAIGNVLGSNVFNILMILGITGLIAPMTIQGITMVDLTVMVVSMLALWMFSFTKYRIQRWEGVVLTLAFVAYITWLIVNAVGAGA